MTCSLEFFIFSLAISLAPYGEARDKQSGPLSKAEEHLIFYDKFAKTDGSRLDLVARHEGFPAENHKITTADGYTLTLTRILPREKNGIGRGEPVILVHGLSCNAGLYLALPPKYNLAYLLASAGYDVWLFNARGKFKSDGHVKYSKKNPDFWSWSHHEVGFYDIPATIDFALKVTRKKQVSLITLSLGSDFVLVALMERPEYNKKVSKVILLTPAFSTRDQSGFSWRLIKLFTKAIHRMNLHHIGNKEIFDNLCSALVYRNCTQKGERKACPAQWGKDMGMAPYNPAERENAVSMYKFKCLNRCAQSLRTMLHANQRTDIKKNTQYSFDSKTNLKMYNSTVPHEYDIMKVTVPTYVYYGIADLTATVKDIEKFCKDQTKTGQKFICIKIRERRFGHGDFIVNTEAKKYVWDDVLKILKPKWTIRF